MTKQAAIFRRVSIGQGCFLVLIMAVKTKFLRFLFALNVMEAAMDIIVGKGRCRLFGGTKQQDEDSCPDKNKQYVADKQFMIFYWFHWLEVTVYDAVNNQ